MSILLTGLEIKHLAESAGFLIDPQSIDFGELEAEHTIEKCDGKGVIDDDGNVQHFNYVTRCEGCDSGECTPLGNPIPSMGRRKNLKVKKEIIAPEIDEATRQKIRAANSCKSSTSQRASTVRMASTKES